MKLSHAKQDAAGKIAGFKNRGYVQDMEDLYLLDDVGVDEDEEAPIPVLRELKYLPDPRHMQPPGR